MAPEDAEEAVVIEHTDVIPVMSPSEAVGFLTEQLPLEPAHVDLDSVFEKASAYDIYFSEIRGQEARSSTRSSVSWSPMPAAIRRPITACCARITGSA